MPHGQLETSSVALAGELKLFGPVIDLVHAGCYIAVQIPFRGEGPRWVNIWHGDRGHEQIEVDFAYPLHAGIPDEMITTFSQYDMEEHPIAETVVDLPVETPAPHSTDPTEADHDDDQAVEAD
eukprot:4557954-Pyramimonas_sp.AAC.2